MTLHDWLTTMLGKWLTVYTLDVCVGDDGRPLAHVGKLTHVGADFIELISVDGFKSIMVTQHLCSVHQRSDGEKMTLSSMEHASEAQVDAGK